MNVWLLALVGIIYLAVAIGYWREGNAGMTISFIAYSLANLGFILAAWRI
jgi:hypothetical protein